MDRIFISAYCFAIPTGYAFAYLAQLWPPLRPALMAAMLHADIDLGPFIKAFDEAVPFTMGLCPRVTANCFVNATYDPGLRNGTCPDAVGQFFVGYEWENWNNNFPRNFRNGGVPFPFDRYGQTSAWREAAVFAVNTALNFII